MVEYVNIERTIAVFKDKNGLELKRAFVDKRMEKFPKNAFEYSLYKFFEDETSVELSARIGALMSEINESNCHNKDLLKVAKVIASIPRVAGDNEYIYYNNGNDTMISQVSENTRLVPNFKALSASFASDMAALESLSIDNINAKTKKI